MTERIAVVASDQVSPKGCPPLSGSSVNVYTGGTALPHAGVHAPSAPLQRAEFRPWYCDGENKQSI
jgi:hypothetical protein